MRNIIKDLGIKSIKLIVSVGRVGMSQEQACALPVCTMTRRSERALRWPSPCASVAMLCQGEAVGQQPAAGALWRCFALAHTAAVVLALQTNNPRKLNVLNTLGVKVVGRIPCAVQGGEYNQVCVVWLEVRLVCMQ